MPRRRSAAHVEDEVAEPNLPVALPRSRHTAGVDRDPREPLVDGAVETLEDQRRLARPEEQRAQDLSTIYARNLVANRGDVVHALMATFEVPEKEALARMEELHSIARGSSRSNTNAADIIERHDLTLEVRLAKIRELLFSPNPGVALKAIELANEMDATSKTKRFGTTWEDFIRKARENALKNVTPGKTNGARKRA